MLFINKYKFVPKLISLTVLFITCLYTLHCHMASMISATMTMLNGLEGKNNVNVDAIAS